MQRTTTFAAGGGLAIGLGGALVLGLVWSGAGAAALGGWFAAALSIGLGIFFLHVAREAQRFRTEFLRAAEEGRPPPPGGPPL